MDIIVCVKWTPDTSEAELEIAKDGTDVKKDDLDYDINDWDRFAVEEAVQIKERRDGKVTVVTVAPEDSEEMLRECLARGADEAYQLWDESFEGADGYAVAKVLANFCKERPYNLILTGSLAGDDCAGEVGGMLAAMLDLPYASLVSKIEINDSTATFNKELEGGLYSSLEIDLPAALAVATGLNEPRFVSIRAVRKVASAEIPNMGADDLHLSADQVGADGSRVVYGSMALPPEGEGAEIIPGGAEQASARLAEILKEKGGIG